MTHPPPSSPASGGGQTSNRNGHNAADPQLPTNAARMRLIWALTLSVAVLVTMFAVAAAAGWIGRQRVVSGHPAALNGQVSGDRADWERAVCADGSVSRLSDGRIRYPNVADYASCMSRVPGSGGGVVPIVIGEWENASTMRRDLARSKPIQRAASAQLGDHVVAFAPIGDTGTAPLEPLVRFGFSVAPLR